MKLPKFKKPDLSLIGAVFSNVVDSGMVIVFVIVAVWDFFGTVTMGGYAFFFVYTYTSLMRARYWKQKYKKLLHETDKS